MGSKGGAATAGYKYFFGIHMGLSRGPVDEIVEIKVGDKTAWQGSITDNGDTAIDAPELFGGDKQEGGIKGVLSMMMGGATQTAVAGLVSMLGHALPGFRGTTTCFFNGTIASNSPYPKPWKFRIRRALKGWENDAPWYPEKAVIDLTGPSYTTPPSYDSETGETIPGETLIPAIKAMNPAHIIYECFTNGKWGRGLEPAAMDAAAFAAAADTLFTEGFGMCIRWTRTDSITNFVQSIVDHIGAAVYTDRETNLITIKLIRGDYDINTLPIYDTNSGLLSISEALISALGPAINEVQITYNEVTTGLSRISKAQNLAMMQNSRAAINPLKKEYPGLPTAELAQRIAQRELKNNAMPLRKFQIVCDRRAWRIGPAGLLRIRDPQRGIGDVVVRVGRIDDGTLVDGKITITAVQDVFSFPLSSFVGVEPPKWVQPNTVPAIKRHLTFELPYFMLNHNMSNADFAHIGNDSGYIGTVVEKPTPLSLAYDVNVKLGESDTNEHPPVAP